MITDDELITLAICYPVSIFDLRRYKKKYPEITFTQLDLLLVHSISLGIDIFLMTEIIKNISL